MATKLSQRLSDGTTITVRRSRTLIGTQFVEVHSVRGVAKHALLWMDGGMYVLYGKGDMMRIRHPDYSFAPTEAEAGRKALAFFVDSAESVIEHAKSEGIPVADCY
ncbi:hypothetical protein ACTOB_007922 [Actinoplanes oblitus]|uniref:Uncharacterized protein n=1 Tax=Actinoplanes oblitus TaxID=3040509 RepID=A0ABY8WHF3_9ACTN|nr:hypothetical protein [Actinoplanes oblitus]WIM95789.1 hypothetical protein ACTOB_007922 [Actinoplanes oblitus]